jgi:hypothetical protein
MKAIVFLNYKIGASMSFIFMFIVSLLVLSCSAAEEKLPKYLEAIRAVELRDYDTFEKILLENPQIGLNLSDEECPLLCELQAVFQKDDQGDNSPVVDLHAIKIALDHGVRLSTYPSLLSGLLVQLTFHDQIDSKKTDDLAQCYRIRSDLLSMINQLMSTEEVKGSQVLESNGNKISVSEFYIFQLCQEGIFCKPELDKVDLNTRNEIRKGITNKSKSSIIEIAASGFLNNTCVSAFF